MSIEMIRAQKATVGLAKAKSLVNATPGSAIEVFRKVQLDEVVT